MDYDYTPLQPAAAPGAQLKDLDLVKWLEKKLGDLNDQWTGRTAASFLSKEMIEELETCFQALEPQVKLKLIMAIPHLPHRLSCLWKQPLSALIGLARRDADDWVETIAEMYREFPYTGRIIPSTSNSDSYFFKSLEELRTLVRKHNEQGDLKLLPPGCKVVAQSVLKQRFGIGEVEVSKHFNLRRKPKSTLLKQEVLKGAEALSNPQRPKNGIVSSLPIKVRSTARKPNNDLPMKGIPKVNTCKLSQGFTNEPKKFQRQLSKREGGAKLLDICEIPQSLKKRRRESDTDDKKKKFEEKEITRKKAVEEKETRLANIAKAKEDARLAAEQKKVDKTDGKKDTLVKHKSSMSPSKKTETSTDGKINASMSLQKFVCPSVIAEDPTADDDTDSVAEDEKRRSVDKLASPTSSTSLLTASTRDDKETTPEPARRTQREAFNEVLNRLQNAQSHQLQQMEQMETTPNIPEQQQILSPTQRSIPSQQQTSKEQQHQPVQQPLYHMQRPQQTSQPSVSYMQQHAQLQSPLHSPTQMQPPRGPMKMMGGEGSGVHRMQIQPQQQQQLQSNQHQQLGTGVQQPAYMQMSQQHSTQRMQHGQTSSHQGLDHMYMQQQPQQHATPSYLNVQLNPTIHTEADDAERKAREAIRRQCEDMLRSANRLDPNGEKMVMNFMTGNKNNPRPELGHIITLKLSETIEDGVVEGRFCKMRVETFFQMDYATGEWKRLRKCKLLREDELQQATYPSQQSQPLMQQQPSQPLNFGAYAAPGHSQGQY